MTTTRRPETLGGVLARDLAARMRRVVQGLPPLPPPKEPAPCEACDGIGQTADGEPCPECDGSGDAEE